MLLIARIGAHTLHLRSPAEVQKALLALYRVNVALLEEWPDHWPRLYDSGVRWQLERDPRSQGGEDWHPLNELYDGRETADCEDIAAARAAERRGRAEGPGRDGSRGPGGGAGVAGAGGGAGGGPRGGGGGDGEM